MTVDGLVSPCARCRRHPVRLDYLVSDEFWQRHVPTEWTADVVCFDCLNEVSGGVPATEIKKAWLTGKGTAALVRADEYAALRRERGEARAQAHDIEAQLAKELNERARQVAAQRHAFEEKDEIGHQRIIELEREVAALRLAQCHHGWRASTPVDGERIVTPCPSCGTQSIFIGNGGHLTCSMLEPCCKEPSIERQIAALRERAEAAERRLGEAHAWKCGCEPHKDGSVYTDPLCKTLRAGRTKP